METLRILIELLFFWGVILPCLASMLLFLTLFFTRISDVISGKNATSYISGAVFGHISDDCDVPLGWMVLIFWLLTFAKMFMMYAWERCLARCMQQSCCETPRCERVKMVLWYCLAVPLALWELIWPVATLLMLVIARDCSLKLRASAWLVLSPYILQACAIVIWFLWLPCLKPLLCRAGLIPDPANLVLRFTQVRFDRQAFNDDGGYATSCAICLCDFTASDHIVLAPCPHQSHVFHRQCLADWFRTAQTCPLCRCNLNRAQDRELEAALGS